MVKMELIRFIREAFLRPMQTGAIAPSSGFLAREMIRDVAEDARARVIEVGPGTGAITGPLLERMSDLALYTGIEPNPEFLKTLRRRFPGGTFVQDTVQHALRELESDQRPNHVVCSLPWALFPRNLQREILEVIASSLQPRGTFSTYAYLHGKIAPGGIAFKNLMKSYFPDVTMSPVIWRNFPPATVYHARKS